MLIIKRTF